MLELLRVIIICSRYKILSSSDVYLKKINKNIPLPCFYYFILRVCEILCHPFSVNCSNFPQTLCALLQKLGPIYIKLGQTLTTRPDIVGVDIVAALSDLQDKLPPFSSDKVVSIVEQECGSIEKIFKHFDASPVAAASIAQVHEAHLHDNTKVAVKILRPNIREDYERDINLLYFIARILDKSHKRLRLIEIIDVLRSTMQRELDLRLEASAYSEMRNNFIEDDSVYIPEIHWEATSEKVLTTTWVDGVSAYNLKAIKVLKIDPVELSKKIAIMFFNQSYRDGFFHADMHAGNIFVTKDGKIALIDFGITGRLSDHDRFAVAEILFGITKRDYLSVAKTYKNAGYIDKNVDIYLFSERCRVICEPIAELPLKDVSLAKIIEQLLQLSEEFGMSSQPQLALLQKSMVIVEGIGKSLDNNINMWKLAEPWIKKWAAKNISPEAKLLRFVKQWIEERLTH